MPSRPRSITRVLSGWGNFPREECQILRPERSSDLTACLEAPSAHGRVPRGCGRSYGDAALNHGGVVVFQERLDRLLAFDETTGTLEAEGGVTIATLFTLLVPRGWLLVTTPGTKFVTLGGAIAADVHGKNHHRDGSFVEQVIDFRLLTPTGEVLRCSRDANADVFWATVGGMGLTGFILSARIRLERIETAYAAVSYRKTKSLDETVDALAATDKGFRFSVGWLDGFATGAKLGRGILMLGTLAAREALPVKRRAEALRLPSTPTIPVPFEIPGGIPVASVKIFNRLYYARHPRQADRIVDLERYFYPLDRLSAWNRLYGRLGFSQFQAIFPFESARDAVREALETVQKAKRAPFLSVLKAIGAQNPGPLSFCRPGLTLALDLPSGDAHLKTLLRSLTELTLRYGGRIYLAKDAALEPLAFHAMYPEAPRFRALQRRLDPQGRFRSSLSRRIGLLEE